MASKTKITHTQEACLTCDTCGMTTKFFPRINTARKWAEEAGWLVAYPNGRRKGKYDYCPADRPADLPECVHNGCVMPGQYILKVSEKAEFAACGRHQQIVLKDLFNLEPDTTINVRRLRASLGRPHPK